ncbi:unnamed protein product [Bemisia tabaci]|uniref:TATA box-binding protein-like 1 n=1 Tax=Bemisia tabaci TaxID=7038 RepID=A0A9P0F8X8_BEMTA|nr:PREDICTED: TATA box-binding protein-like protein 1 [Bemisia tabaci]CAH0392945.1 unnamed protein product [Bemisia tabaci]
MITAAFHKNGMKHLANGNLNNHCDDPRDESSSNISKDKSSVMIPEQDYTQPPVPQGQENTPEIDIVINNVVCSFSVRCHLNLRQIALNGCNVEYKREYGMVTMKIRKPYTTASIWSSGKITCTGATSEDQSRIAARRFARALQKLGFKTRFTNFRITNVLGTCSMPFGIKINQFSTHHREAEYEPELHPGVTFKIRSPKATLKIFSTGSITVTAGSVLDVQQAIEHIFPLVYPFRKERTKEDELALEQRLNKAKKRKATTELVLDEVDVDIDEPSDDASDVDSLD